MAKTDAQPIEIFHIEGRRSFRIAWLCQELGIPYTLTYKPRDLFGSMQTIRSTHPIMPMAPVVRIGDQMVVESGAICDILVARAGGRLRPSVESDDFLLHTQWMHFAEGTAQARMLMWRFVAMVLGKDVDQIPQGYRANVSVTPTSIPDSPLQTLGFLVGPRGIFDAIDAHLKEHSYFGGAEFSAADIMMHYQVRHSMLMSLIDLNDYPTTLRWKLLVEKRPAFLEADKKCHPRGLSELGLPVGETPPFPLRSTSAQARKPADL
jgi:glutathione S-transferase